MLIQIIVQAILTLDFEHWIDPSSRRLKTPSLAGHELRRLAQCSPGLPSGRTIQYEYDTVVCSREATKINGDEFLTLKIV